MRVFYLAYTYVHPFKVQLTRGLKPGDHSQRCTDVDGGLEQQTLSGDSSKQNFIQQLTWGICEYAKFSHLQLRVS